MSVGQSLEPRHTLPTDFADRLERSLPGADSERRRRVWTGRLRRFLPLVLLVGPPVAWRLMLSTPDGVHVTVTALTWTTFVLDLGVHVDTSVLSYLGLAQLPSVVGALLAVMLTVSLLWQAKERD
jgi:hypothetical protein